MIDVATIQSNLKNVRDLVVAEHTESGHFYRYLPTGELFPSVTTKIGILEGGQHLKVWSARLAVEKMTERILSIPLMKRIEENIVPFQHEAILVHQDQFEDAGGVGTKGHNIIDRYLQVWLKNGKKPSEPITNHVGAEGADPRVWAIARSAEKFINDFYAIPVASEFFVASVKYKYAGTLDGLMMVLIVKEKCEGKLADHFFLHRSTKNPLKMECMHCGLKADYIFALTDWKSSNQINKPEYALQVSAYWKALHEMCGLKPKKLLIIRLDKKQAKYEVMEVVNPQKAFKAFIAVTKAYDWLSNGVDKLFSLTPKEIISLK